ncbi:MAG TPA: SurA N-terminal domain-containing protein [Actinomycetes bacterium]|nr:SurA N-terminal domain-containing protein [Actinomycetes bacterium]
MRRLFPAVCLATVLLGAGCASNTSGQAATVNGVSVPVSRLAQMVKAQLAQQQSQQSQQQSQQQAPDIDGLTRQSLEGLIQFQLILGGARKAGITVPEEQVDARIQQVKQQAKAQGMKYEDLLSQNSLTDDLLREQFRAQVALDMLGTKLVPYSPDSLLLKRLGQHKTDYVQVHVRHVLLKDPSTANKARQQLVSGGNWVAVAKRYSIDAQTKDRGGDLSFLSKGQTVAQFEHAAFVLADQGSCRGKTTGDCVSPISAPVHTQFGYHLIQVIGLRQPALDNDLRGQLDPTVKQRRDAAVQAWFADQVKSASVTVNPRFGRWDAATGKVVERSTAPGGAPQSGQGQPVPGQP